MTSTTTRRITFPLLVLSSLSLLAWAPATSTRGQKTVPVALSGQPEPEAGVIPVELKCSDAELPAPDRLGKLSCAIKNNTRRSISAVVVSISISVEKDGQEAADTSFLTLDTFLHPDFREDHRNNLILPGQERPFHELPTSYDAVIKGVAVGLDYVEFEDSTVLGPDAAGSRIIGRIRGGAAKYKNWLAKAFEQGGGSVHAVIPLLTDRPIPEEELSISNGDEQQGAILYRNYARRLYESKGAEGLAKRLKRAGAPAGGPEVER